MHVRLIINDNVVIDSHVKTPHLVNKCQRAAHGERVRSAFLAELVFNVHVLGTGYSLLLEVFKRIFNSNLRLPDGRIKNPQIRFLAQQLGQLVSFDQRSRKHLTFFTPKTTHSGFNRY